MVLRLNASLYHHLLSFHDDNRFIMVLETLRVLHGSVDKELQCVGGVRPAQLFQLGEVAFSCVHTHTGVYLFHLSVDVKLLQELFGLVLGFLDSAIQN